MVRKIVQSWWHFEDKTKHSYGKKIKQVLDLFTDEQFVSFKIPSFFIKLGVKSRYKGNELEFIENKNIFTINLGNLEEWPYSIDKTLKHVKLEISYIDVNPNFEKRSLFNPFKTGYETTCTIKDITQPEFYIKVPLGMKIKSNYMDFWNKTIDGNKFVNLLRNIKTENNKLKDKVLLLEESNYIGYDYNNKNSYNFIISDNSYDEILDLITDKKRNLETINLYYTVINQNKYWLITVFPIFLILLAIFNFNYLIDNNFNFINFSVVVIYLSFLIFYYNLVREGYEIPFDKSLFISIPISGFIILFPNILQLFSKLLI